MEHEYIAIIPPLWVGDKPMTIGVDKIGGGTLGCEYDGAWLVSWYDDGNLLDSGTINTGTPKRHDQAAAIAGQFFTEEFDTEETWPTYDRVQLWASQILKED